MLRASNSASVGNLEVLGRSATFLCFCSVVLHACTWSLCVAVPMPDDTGVAEETEDAALDRTENGDEITGMQGGAGDTMLPPGGWFPFALIILSLLGAVTLSKHLEKKGTPGGEYGVVDH